MRKSLVYIKKEISHSTPKGINIKIEELDVKRINELKQIRELSPAKLNQFKNRFSKGDRCFIAKTVNDEICHYSWLRERGVMHIFEVNKKFVIQSNMCWIFDCRTKDSFKGRGIYPKLLSRLSNVLLENSHINEVYIDVSAKNVASIKGIEKAGFKPTREVFLIWKFPIVRRLK
jgi:prolyl-tRNA synthetase